MGQGERGQGGAERGKLLLMQKERRAVKWTVTVRELPAAGLKHLPLSPNTT